MEKIKPNTEPSPRDIAESLLQILGPHDNEVQNGALEYVIKLITSNRSQEIEKLETKVMSLRNAKHDLTTRLAYINHTKS